MPSRDPSWRGPAAYAPGDARGGGIAPGRVGLTDTRAKRPVSARRVGGGRCGVVGLVAALALTALVPSAVTAVPPSPPAAAQAGDAIPDVATQRAVLDRSYAYFAAKDGGRYDAAYAFFAPSVRAYLTPDLYRTQTAEFNAGAGKGERRIVTLTWERDPPEAPAPGLYVAADFVSRFANLRLHCGYLMWRREADGTFRIVREEQSFLDNGAASRLTPERLRPLPQQFGCPDATAALE